MTQLIDAPRSNLDNTVRVFDQFYNFDLVVNADQYEVIYSFFFDVTKSASTAKNFTTIIFRIASITGEDVMKLLAYINGETSLQVSSIMIYYLNSLKSKTTLYGISTEPIPNESAQRNIVS